jgi:hypothetical protein
MLSVDFMRFYTYLAKCSADISMFQTKFAEKIETRVYIEYISSLIFSPIYHSGRLWG